MVIDGATFVELLNMGMAICIVIISIYASKKFSLHIFKRGWLIVALSGVVMATGSILRVYYSYANLYAEWAWLGRVFILVHLFMLMIGIYLLAMTAVKMWSD